MPELRLIRGEERRVYSVGSDGWCLFVPAGYEMDGSLLRPVHYPDWAAVEADESALCRVGVYAVKGWAVDMTEANL